MSLRLRCDAGTDSALGGLQVTATDGDQDRPQNIVYFLTGQGIDPDNPANSKFDINKTTGDIYVLKVSGRGDAESRSGGVGSGAGTGARGVGQAHAPPGPATATSPEAITGRLLVPATNPKPIWLCFSRGAGWPRRPSRSTPWHCSLYYHGGNPISAGWRYGGARAG